MNQEVAFAKTLEEVRSLAASQGNVISKEQVEEAFGSIGMDKEALAPIYDYLKQKKMELFFPFHERLLARDALSYFFYC